ncbi:hypothetical protein MNEG_10547, partial [Monoraphidium neglectum]
MSSRSPSRRAARHAPALGALLALLLAPRGAQAELVESFTPGGPADPGRWLLAGGAGGVGRGDAASAVLEQGGQRVMETKRMVSDGTGVPAVFYYKFVPCNTAPAAQLAVDGWAEGRGWRPLWSRAGANLAGEGWTKVKVRPPLSAAGAFALRWTYRGAPGSDCRLYIDDVTLPAAGDGAEGAGAAAGAGVGAAGAGAAGAAFLPAAGPGDRLLPAVAASAASSPDAVPLISPISPAPAAPQPGPPSPLLLGPVAGPPAPASPAPATAPAAAAAAPGAGAFIEAFRPLNPADPATPKVIPGLWQRAGQIVDNGRGMGFERLGMNLDLQRNKVAQTSLLAGTPGADTAVTFYYKVRWRGPT